MKTHPDVFRAEVFTFDEFLWALSILWSRAFAIEIEGKETRGLVPVADLFNAPSAKDHMVKVQAQMSKGALTYVASADIAAGEGNVALKLGSLQLLTHLRC